VETCLEGASFLEVMVVDEEATILVEVGLLLEVVLGEVQLSMA
jgi:hypothetical protein